MKFKKGDKVIRIQDSFNPITYGRKGQIFTVAADVENPIDTPCTDGMNRDTRYLRICSCGYPVTDWISPKKQLPTIPGVYQITYYNALFPSFCKWDGKKWMASFSNGDINPSQYIFDPANTTEDSQRDQSSITAWRGVISEEWTK